MKKLIGLSLFSLSVAAVIQLTAVRLSHSEVSGDEGEAVFSKTRILIEYNATDEDVGVQVLLDGEPWKKVQAFAPDGRLILDILARRNLQKQGLTELFFESSEPSLADVSLEEFLGRFPEGQYEFEGKTTGGREIEGVGTLTHVIPAGVEIISPASSDETLPVVSPDACVIEWEPVTETIDGSSDIEIVSYQVIVEQVDPLRVFSIHVPAAVTRVTVPPEFFAQADTVHKFEVLAIETGGNQTIISGEFVTTP